LPGGDDPRQPGQRFHGWAKDPLAFAEVTEAKWQAKERRAPLHSRAAAAREGMRIWQAARELECSMTALALALAVHTGPLVRAARGHGGLPPEAR
jgi:hypothetical protein